MSTFLQTLYDRARPLHARIILPEAADPRMQAAAARAKAEGLAEIIFVDTNGSAPAGFETHDPADSPLSAELAATFQRLRAPRPMSDAAARAAVADPYLFAALMVTAGHADATIAGAVAPSPQVIRAALRGIGAASGTKTVTSIFLMLLPETEYGPAHPVVFSDCALIAAPTPTELAAIASAAARACRQFLHDTPRVAMLSFSTASSAEHSHVSKVQEALTLLRAAEPDLAVDGEMQFDAAFVPAIAATKYPGSDVAGRANVFIFPNLDAGNIGYKIAQRIGGATAIGPIILGLAHPANDLSRGCSADDICNMIVVTALQCAEDQG